MRTTFDNSQCAHVWAQQNQSEGKSSNGNLYFRDRTIYSYGEHFPIATFINSETVLVNSDSYSVSTAKQQGYVRSAISHKKRIYASTAVIKAVCLDNTFNNAAQREAVDACTRDVEILVEKASKRKAAKFKARDIAEASAVIETCKALFDSFATGYPESLRELAAMFGNADYVAVIEEDKKRKAQLEADKKLAYQLRQKALVNDIKRNWIKGEPMKAGNSPYQCEKIFMRITGDNIETTRGASFPLSHGKKAFTLIRKIKEQGATMPKGKSIHLGNFTIDSIAPNGDVKAGCHFIEWSEIKRLATLLNLYP